MSYHQLTSLEKPEQLKAHEAKWGQFNDPPPGFREITAEQFAESGFFTWCKTGVEFRQIDPNRIKDAKKVLLSPMKTFLFPITMFYMNHGENFAMGRWSEGDKTYVRYFTFADCYHEYRGMTDKELAERNIRLLRCDHALMCKKCGYVYMYNSSD